MVSGFLQFAVLPQVMQLIEPSTLWRIVPAIVLTFASNMSLNKDPSLYLIAGTFLTMKALEFSARRMLDEMVYVPLDYDAVSFAYECMRLLDFFPTTRPFLSCILSHSPFSNNSSDTLGRKSLAFWDIDSASRERLLLFRPLPPNLVLVFRSSAGSPASRAWHGPVALGG